MRNLVWREVLPPKEQEESRNQLISAVHVKELNAMVFVSLAGGTNKVWRFELGSETWETVLTEGDGPSGISEFALSFSHPVVYLQGGRLNEKQFTSDLFGLDVVRWRWSRMFQLGAPAPRVGQIFFAHDDFLFVFGGSTQDEQFCLTRGHRLDLSRAEREGPGTSCEWEDFALLSGQGQKGPRTERKNSEFAGRSFAWTRKDAEVYAVEGFAKKSAEKRRLLTINLISRQVSVVETQGCVPPAFVQGKMHLWQNQLVLWCSDGTTDELFALDLRTLLWAKVSVGCEFPSALFTCAQICELESGLCLAGSKEGLNALCFLAPAKQTWRLEASLPRPSRESIAPHQDEFSVLNQKLQGIAIEYSNSEMDLRSEKSETARILARLQFLDENSESICESKREALAEAESRAKILTAEVAALEAREKVSSKLLRLKEQRKALVVKNLAAIQELYRNEKLYSDSIEGLLSIRELEAEAKPKFRETNRRVQPQPNRN